jgi:hypothetical protein
MEVEMKMVKSLLLGTAAGVVAVAGAQAADMPVKAKPIEFVRICSLYGDGFYYMPGTDICIKLGGYVRSQHYYNYGANATQTPFFGINVQNDRFNAQTDYTHRTRSLISVDTRQQTEWGTLRTYFTIGHTSDFNQGGLTSSTTALYANRGFIQFAGFTLGLASSFFDFFSSPIVSYFAVNSEDTGDGGWKVAAYTANFGNGFTATVSLEEPRRLSIVNTALAAQGTGAFNANNTTVGFQFNDPFLVGGVPNSDYATIRWPDIVMNLRVDQAWGAAMIGGAIHDSSGGYYGQTLTGSQVNGHPPDKVGWAGTVGLRLNAPGGSFFQAQAVYTEGALRYLSHTQFPVGGAARFGVGNSLGLGWATDGIFGTGTDVELTRGWGVFASYDHVWVPGKWRTSLYGGYIKVEYNDAAVALIATSTCGVFPTAGGTVAAPAATSGSLTGMTNCDPDFAIGYVGTRTQYNFTPDFYAGFDVIYTKLNSGFKGLANYRAVANTPRPTGVYAIEDQDNLAVTVRFHRDFKP